MHASDFGPDFAAATLRYRRHFASLGVERFLHAFVILDRPAAPSHRTYTVATPVDPARLRHRHPVTPYAGRTLTGVVRRTWLRGQLATAAPAGRLLARQADGSGG